MSGALLEVEALSVSYGGIRAVRGVSLEVRKGELVTLIGANGAGKTTVLKTITATLPRCEVEGRVRYKSESLKGLKASALVGKGLVMVPEGRGIFSRMSVRENLLMGAYLRTDREAVETDIEKWFERFPRLRERAPQLAGTLSGGEQQMLAMARALMTQPELLLLDEPSMGLAPIMVEKIFEVIRQVVAQGTTIFLVEQNANLALQVADRAYVMETGLIAFAGGAKELLNDQRIKAAYLGEE